MRLSPSRRSPRMPASASRRGSGRIFRAEEMAHPTDALTHPIFHQAVALVEDRRALRFVKPQDFARRQSKPKSDGNDAAGGGAGDQIEIGSDRRPSLLFQLGEKCGRKNTTDAAAIERKYFV